jgi:hypothetical protein
MTTEKTIAAAQGNQPSGQQNQTDSAKKGDEGNQPAAGASPYRPDGMQDHYAGASDRETIDRLYKDVKGFRDAQAVKGVPAKPEDYKLDLAPEIQQKITRPGNDGSPDPVLIEFQKIFHEEGIPQKSFNAIVGRMYEKVAALSAEREANQPKPGENQPTLDFEFKDMGGVEKVKPLQDGAAAWINGLKQQGKIDDGDAEEMQLMALHPAGLKTLLKIREMSGEQPIPASLDGGQKAQGVTEADLNQRIGDPRYIRGHKQFDQAFHDETTRMFQNFYNKSSGQA